MNALIINCSPVRTGATAEIVKIVSEQLSERYSVKSICIIAMHFVKAVAHVIAQQNAL